MTSEHEMRENWRPTDLPSITGTVVLEGRPWFITISYIDHVYGSPFELYLHKNKGGPVHASYLAAVGKLASVALQYGIPVNDVGNMLVGESDGTVSFDGDRVYLGLIDAAGKMLLRCSNTGVVKCGKCGGDIDKQDHYMKCIIP